MGTRPWTSAVMPAASRNKQEEACSLWLCVSASVSADGSWEERYAGTIGPDHRSSQVLRLHQPVGLLLTDFRHWFAFPRIIALFFFRNNLGN